MWFVLGLFVFFMLVYFCIWKGEVEGENCVFDVFFVFVWVVVVEVVMDFNVKIFFSSGMFVIVMGILFVV